MLVNANLCRLMKRLLLLVLPAIFVGTACERHSASSLPAHGGGHSEGHGAAAADAHASDKAHAPEAPTPAKPAAPKDAPAAKFFDQQPK